MANTTVTLITKNDKRTDTPCWAVEFINAQGQTMRTSWTTYRNEAIAWGRNVQMTGWTTEGRPLPTA